MPDGNDERQAALPPRVGLALGAPVKERLDGNGNQQHRKGHHGDGRMMKELHPLFPPRRHPAAAAAPGNTDVRALSCAIASPLAIRDGLLQLALCGALLNGACAMPAEVCTHSGHNRR